MHTRRLNLKKYSVLCSIGILVYIFLSCGYHKYQIDGVIKNAKPEDVWSYVADFSKMRLLNPTILDFKVISDTGTPHNWHYTVLYTERLSHWPYWLNTATAYFVVKKSMPGETPVFHTIESKHQTCFFKGLYCLNAESEFKFSGLSTDTYCVEKIRYQCPPFLSSACRRELEFQREAVMHNLTTIFRRK